MAIHVGEMNTLEVIRETEISYILSDGDNTAFLHKKQATKELTTGDNVDVFLYFDNQKRLTATMNKPIIDTDTPAFCEVVGVNHRLGVFLDIGIAKDLLLSRDDLSFKKKEWPKEGDRIFVKLKISKNQLTAKIVPRFEIRDYLSPKTELIEGESYKAYCVFIAEEGLVFCTEEGHYIFVYFKHIRKDYRLGEVADVRIIMSKMDKKYNGTLVEQKELMLSQDAETIKSYLEAHDGEMPFTDKSSPEDIKEQFHMSKAAFKRALGTLYKEKLVELNADSTTLIKQVEKTK